MRFEISYSLLRLLTSLDTLEILCSYFRMNTNSYSVIYELQTELAEQQ